MSITRTAKIANARRAVVEHLTGCPFPDEVARDIVDALLNLGWTYPGMHLDDDIPQPSHSTPAGRAAARRIYETVKAEKEATR